MASPSPSPAVAKDLLPALKAELGHDLAENAKDYNLLKYLHWKQDVKRAAGRYRGLLQWRKENTFAFDDPSLLASKDFDLQRVLKSEVIVAPEGMVDKQGRTVLVGRLRNNDMSDGRSVHDVARMMVYTIDRVLESENAQRNGVVVFHDMKGFSRKNVDIRIPKLLLSALIGHFPIRIHGIYILDAPFFFRKMLFPGLSLLMPSKLKSRIHFVDDISDVYEVIDQDEMLEEHGGKRTHDSSAWVASQVERENKGAIQSLGDCPLHK